MLRFYYVILISFPLIVYYIIRCNYVTNHIKEYSETERYSIAQNIIKYIRKNGRITTSVYGVENLPKDGGYVMYPNHQGRYDALGIIYAHKEPCTFVIDKERAKIPIAREVSNILEAGKLDKTNLKNQARTMSEVTKQVKEGRRYIIFPEGGYTDNKNNVCDFLPGTFKCSVRSKTPIVPVALIDSYKPFGVNSLKKVNTQVHFLEPIYYEDYKDLDTIEIAEMVRSQIVEKVAANEAM